MENPIDLSLILNWPQATVACFLILAVLVWPGVMAWLNIRKNSANTKDIKTTLTENNGGSSVKDQMDRLEANQETFMATQAKTDERLTALEKKPRQR